MQETHAQYPQSNICIITHTEPGLSETFIRAHIERLPGNPIVFNNNWKYNFDNNRFLPFPIWLLLKGIRAVARQQGVVGEIAGGLVRATEILLIKNFFQRHNIDVVLAEFGMAGVEVLDVCIRAKIPLVVNFHGYDAFHADILNSYQHEYRRMFEIASSIIVGSYHMEKQLVALGAPQEKVVCHHLAVDVDEFKGGDPAESLPVFVAVGRFVDKKAPHLTILAFSEIAQQQPQARLIMVGTGVLFEACQQLIKALGLSEQIQLVGARPHHEVAELLRKARVFVQHSVTTHYGDSEGTVVSVLEACATGLPVVCTRHAGMNDTVLHGETGFLVDEGDIEGMAAHMLTLARDADLAGRMGRRAREHVAANFSMEQHIARLAEVLEGAAQRNPT